ncbi:MAG: (2Fe-2S)-binding protein [Desulfobacterales bacterium]|nr:MAG: (2Fe-2S)-binding protein [Desulfobacterales bacterium]
MEQIELTIDDKKVNTKAGTKILEAALDAEIYIPNLCYIAEAELPYGGCRLCYVHVEGRGLVTACTLPVENGMVVHTQTPEVMRVRRTAYKLLIAYHNLDCRACWKNKKCDLQKLAAKVKVKLKRPEDFRGLPTEFLPLDTTNPYITYDPLQCIICGKCVWVCSKICGEPLLDFAYRGNKTRLTLSPDAVLVEEKCPSCGQCAVVCPTAALQPQGPLASNEHSAEAG